MFVWGEALGPGKADTHHLDVSMPVMGHYYVLCSRDVPKPKNPSDLEQLEFRCR